MTAFCSIKYVDNSIVDKTVFDKLNACFQY